MRPFRKLTREQLIDKINKIMALGVNNPNEAEAASAAEIAQSLLAQYHLTHADLAQAGKEAMSDIFVNGDCVLTEFAWAPGLAMAVAQLYFCGYFFRKMPRSRQQHTFIGAKHHTEIARSMFEYLYRTVDRLARRTAVEKKIPQKERSPYRVTFRVHASIRLQDRLIKRRRAAEAGQIKAVEEKDGVLIETNRNLPALLNTYKLERDRVEDFMSKTFKIKTKKSNLATLHTQGMIDGRAAGESIGLDTQIENKGQRRISSGG